MIINIYPRRALVSIASAQDLATYLTDDIPTGLYRANEVALIFQVRTVMERFFAEILADIRSNAKLQRLEISEYEIVDLSDGDSDNLNFLFR